MKKILTALTFGIVLALTACSNSNETTCSMEDNWGDSFTVTIESSDNDVTNLTLVEEFDVSDWSQAEIDREIRWVEDDGGTCSRRGDSLTCTFEVDTDELSTLGLSPNLDELIRELESEGFECN